jgi:mRNA-degrading endonuclease toxin of MazEF toxin-antitoxin module
MSVGEVHWVEFPARGGHAQAGRRPAIVVQGRAASLSLPTVLLVPLTSQLDALRFPGTVLVEADTQNGLHRASVALVFQMTAVDNRFIAERLGSVSETVLQRIWSAFDTLTERLRAEPA